MNYYSFIACIKFYYLNHSVTASVGLETPRTKQGMSPVEWRSGRKLATPAKLQDAHSLLSRQPPRNMSSADMLFCLSTLWFLFGNSYSSIPEDTNSTTIFHSRDRKNRSSGRRPYTPGPQNSPPPPVY